MVNTPALAIIKNGKIEPLDSLSFPEGTRLLITPLPQEEDHKTEEPWYNLSEKGLNQAYGEDEPEYILENIKEMNKDYEGE